MNLEFLKSGEFWAAVFAAITIAVSAWKPELRETLEALAPLLVTIIVAIFGGVALRAWTDVAAMRAGYVKRNGAWLPK